MRRGAAAAIVALTTLFVSPVAAHAESYGATVKALDNVFAPEIVRVAVGASVEWRNDGNTLHTVTADDGSWGSGDLASGDEFTQTFEQPGVYRYYCRFHGS